MIGMGINIINEIFYFLILRLNQLPFRIIVSFGFSKFIDLNYNYSKMKALVNRAK